MSLVDWVIAVILLISVVGAARKGLVMEAFSLGGVIAGLVVASWNYQRLMPWARRWIQTEAIAEALCFLVMALAVALLAGLVGRLVRATIHQVGLGWADRCLGAIFGFVKGCVVVTLGVVVVAAFLPKTVWFDNSRLAPWFLSMAHSTAIVTPSELGERIREGVKMIRNAQPDWQRQKAAFAPAVDSENFAARPARRA